LTAGRAVAASSLTTTAASAIGTTADENVGFLLVDSSNKSYTITARGNDQANARVRIKNTGAGGEDYAFVAGQNNIGNVGLSLFKIGVGTSLLLDDGSGNFNVSGGNVIIGTAGKGIDFSANGGDVLSQYDEGTFTPAVAFNNLSTGVTYSTRTGAYTRIGRCVYFSIDIVLTSKGSATGNMTVTGLPLTSMATNAYGVSFADWYDFNFLTVSPIYGKINPSNTNISMFRQAMAGYVQAITDAEVQNNTQFRVSGFYFV